jgi:hypothetical protein
MPVLSTRDLRLRELEIPREMPKTRRQPATMRVTFFKHLTGDCPLVSGLTQL